MSNQAHGSPVAPATGFPPDRDVSHCPGHIYMAEPSAPHFLHLSNLTGIGLEMAFVAIPAVGMTYLFISGEFDLSPLAASCPWPRCCLGSSS